MQRTCTEEVADAVIDRMCEGEFVQDLCREFGTSVTAFWRFRNASEEHRKAYAQAREIQAAAVAHKGFQRAWNAEDAQLDRLAFDAAKWLAAKIDPANFNDKTTTEHTGSVALQHDAIDRPPAETREEWIARRQRELDAARLALAAPAGSAD